MARFTELRYSTVVYRWILFTLQSPWITCSTVACCVGLFDTFFLRSGRDSVSWSVFLVQNTVERGVQQFRLRVAEQQERRGRRLSNIHRGSGWLPQSSLPAPVWRGLWPLTSTNTCHDNGIRRSSSSRSPQNKYRCEKVEKQTLVSSA